MDICRFEFVCRKAFNSRRKNLNSIFEPLHVNSKLLHSSDQFGLDDGRELSQQPISYIHEHKKQQLFRGVTNSLVRCSCTECLKQLTARLRERRFMPHKNPLNYKCSISACMCGRVYIYH